VNEELKSEFNGLTILPIRQSAISEYCELLSKSFRGFTPTVAYLNWLYFENPRGLVFGYDAYDGDKLVAHYACIPIKVNAYTHNSLLSLNTATHPDYRGRGLFRALANKTFDSASSTFANVIGVANSKSVSGFTKHLGFSSIGNLDLRIGRLSREVAGSRIFSKEDLDWRSNCPGRPLSVAPLGPGSNLVATRRFKFTTSLKAIVFGEDMPVTYQSHRKIGITLDWRKGSDPALKLPKRLKPSPLVLIFKPLLEPDSTLLTSFSFPDFDAF
jgi:hypothetical protein